MAILINETMASSPATGNVADNSVAYTGWKVGGYFGLTDNVNQWADFYYNLDPTTNFDAYVDMQMGVTNGADGSWFYWGWNTHPQTEGDSTNAGYLINRNDFGNSIEIRFAGSTLASVSYTKDTNFDRLEILFNAGVFTIKYLGSTVLTYTDSSYPRSLPGNEIGFGARCGGTGNIHNIQNLFLQSITSTNTANFFPFLRP